MSNSTPPSMTRDSPQLKKFYYEALEVPRLSRSAWDQVPDADTSPPVSAAVEPAGSSDMKMTWLLQRLAIRSCR